MVNKGRVVDGFLFFFFSMKNWGGLVLGRRECLFG